ncbi:DUF2069 domain-containing protein [Montanilutibacter psychrotolerans]|uniref:DUF2069 domain-containing protein n=1 Tax=Montanilutibacter psychrotolerans TaxID=1327343 RepID=A0A3M8STU9_9GAMM|nr:DUF2069 domain-containing protein [Lysobacter psychrotolerans]RNF84125.1 DUF2069 domain-containing protein [Lysobacter psychrotolerans]
MNANDLSESQASVRRKARIALVASLLALVALFVAWFAAGTHALAAMLVFALPPALLALGAWFGRGHAAFWSGVLALGWFCHGVMLAWSSAPERLYALAEVLLSLAIVFAANAPGLAAKFGKRRG